MDTASHILLGASIGQLCMGEKWGRKAWLWGAVAGSFPDLDVVFQNLFTPAGSALFHRGISHSLLVAVLLLPLLAWFINHQYKGGTAAYKDWLKMSSLAWGSHLFVDAFNAYGTGLLLPFSRTRVAFDTINVIDIAFLLPLLLVFLAFIFVRKTSVRSVIAGVGLLLSFSYLGCTIANKLNVESVVRAQLERLGVPYVRMLTSPLPMTNLAWMVVVEEPDGFKVGTYFQSEQNTIDFTNVPKHYELSNTFRDTRDFKKLERFTKGYYVLREGEHGDITLVDLRFSSLSDSEPSGELQFALQFVMDVTPGGDLVIQRTRPKRHLTRNNLKRYFQRVFSHSGHCFSPHTKSQSANTFVSEATVRRPSYIVLGSLMRIDS